uniref:IRG-type G domain-containing protein n=1 Tax=Panagrolaimus superbus TaxID=310955 RepID=A0A914Z0L8_9BILA
MGNSGSSSADRARAEERARSQAAAQRQQQQFDAALEEARKQRELEQTIYERRKAEEESKKEDAQMKQDQREAQIKEEAEERRREIDRQHQNRMEEIRAQEAERREEERRRREETEQRYKHEQEQRKRDAEIQKREREEAAEKEREILREMHTRDQEHAENVMKIQKEMHNTSLQAQKEKEEQIRHEREVQQQMADKQIQEMRDMHKEEINSSQSRHDEMMKLMTDQLQIQKEQNEKLMQNLSDLLQQFTQSRNDFLAYVKEKPEHDIVVTEDMEETLRKAKADLKLDTVNCYNFAFVGHTKTGKSSLINAIRGLEDSHPDAAAVGITETTHEIKPYTFPDPQFKHVMIYDIPGAGTLTHDANSYYQDKCLCAFDCLIICAQDTLGREEIDFAIQSLRYNQPIAFVRSRCDIVLDNARKNKEIKKIDQNAVFSYINRMSDFYIGEIARAEKPELRRVPCFFVSAYSLRDLINGEEPEAVYHEQAFLDYIKTKSKYSRNYVT